MLKIAVCDDEQEALTQVTTLLDSYRLDHSAAFSYKTFSAGTELLATLRGGLYDVIFLDVMMPGLNGIETAQELRTIDSAVKIIFLTSSPEFAVESYTVQAYHYLLKPVSEQTLFPILDKLLASAHSQLDSMHLKSHAALVTVPFAELLFVEVTLKKLFLHMTDGRVLEVPGTLASVESQLLARPEFVKSHRSIIVNMRWVQALHANEFTISGNKSVPIARQLYTLVREKYMEFILAETGVI